MNTLDIILAVILIFGFVRGLSRGLFVEVASLLALILGIYGAIHFSFFAGNILANYVDWDERYITITSFVITFIIIVVAISMVGKFLTKVADFASLGMLNKLLGGVFNVLKSALVLSILLLILHRFSDNIPFFDEEDQEESVLYEPIKDFAPALFPKFVRVLDDEIDE
jgi:membrane protein required for colicin V production